MKVIDLSDKQLPDDSKSIVRRHRPGTLSHGSKISVEDIVTYLPGNKTISIKDEERQSIDVTLKRMSRGLMYTGVTICPAHGDPKYGSCTFFAECPFSNEDCPYGSKCPLEMAYVQKWFDEYVKVLDVDTHNRVESTMVERLAMIDLEESRAYKKLSAEGFEEQKITKADNGVTIERKLHNAVEYIDKLERRKMSILKSLAATRDSKNKEMGSTQMSASELLAQMRTKLGKE